MSKVLVDRELLELLRNFTFLHDDGCSGALRGNIDKALSAQPAEAEGVGRNAITEEVKSAYYERKSITEAVDAICAALSAVTAERDRLLDQVKALQSDANSWQSGYDKGRHDGTKHRHSEVAQLRAEVEALRKDAVRWRYVRLQGDDTHWLNLLRVDLDEFGGNINAAVDALIDGEAPDMAAKEA